MAWTWLSSWGRNRPSSKLQPSSVSEGKPEVPKQPKPVDVDFEKQAKKSSSRKEGARNANLAAEGPPRAAQGNADKTDEETKLAHSDLKEGSAPPPAPAAKPSVPSITSDELFKELKREGRCCWCFKTTHSSRKCPQKPQGAVNGTPPKIPISEALLLKLSERRQLEAKLAARDEEARLQARQHQELKLRQMKLAAKARIAALRDELTSRRAHQHALRFAVLFDTEGISPLQVQPVLDMVSELGTPATRRAYRDWGAHLPPEREKWRTACLIHGIHAVQQFAYVTGKGAIDAALTIGAMDLLHSGGFDGFCLVANDSDYTPLVMRLRDSGKIVIGFGFLTTPHSFQSACDIYIPIQAARQPDVTSQAPRRTVGTKEDPIIEGEAGEMVREPAVLDEITEAENDPIPQDGMAKLGARTGDEALRLAIERYKNPTSELDEKTDPERMETTVVEQDIAFDSSSACRRQRQAQYSDRQNSTAATRDLFSPATEAETATIPTDPRLHADRTERDDQAPKPILLDIQKIPVELVESLLENWVRLTEPPGGWMTRRDLRVLLLMELTKRFQIDREGLPRQWFLRFLRLHSASFELRDQTLRGAGKPPVYKAREVRLRPKPMDVPGLRGQS